MKTTKKWSKALFVGMIGIALVFVALSGCKTSSSGVTQVGWSEYTAIPSKDYTVVGIVIINPVEDQKTLGAQLMAEAKAAGANDIINVRTDVEVDSSGKETIVAASAVAIKYGETIKEKTTTTVVADGKTVTTANSEGYVFS
ncbi:MAG: hypothetical protein LBI67_06310 [Treponema sp.]|nr:hypothetical protein [Treponema sp.]